MRPALTVRKICAIIPSISNDMPVRERSTPCASEERVARRLEGSLEGRREKVASEAAR